MSPNDSSMDGQVQYTTRNNNIGACPRFEQSSKNKLTISYVVMGLATSPCVCSSLAFTKGRHTRCSPINKRSVSFGPWGQRAGDVMRCEWRERSLTPRSSLGASRVYAWTNGVDCRGTCKRYINCSGWLDHKTSPNVSTYNWVYRSDDHRQPERRRLINSSQFQFHVIHLSSCTELTLRREIPNQVKLMCRRSSHKCMCTRSGLATVIQDDLNKTT